MKIEFTDENGKKSRAEWQEEKDLSSRLAPVCTLKPGESLVIEVPFSDNSRWKGWPKIAGQLPKVKMRAVFENDRGGESRGVWVGKVISEPLMVTFYPP